MSEQKGMVAEADDGGSQPVLEAAFRRAKASYDCRHRPIGHPQIVGDAMESDFVPQIGEGPKVCGIDAVCGINQEVVAGPNTPCVLKFGERHEAAVA